MTFQTSLRTHTCGELRLHDEKKTVSLCGWVHVRRDHGGVVFVDLRDRYGVSQVVFEPGHNDAMHKLANTLRREDCIRIAGVVRRRKEGMANPRLATGEIEVFVDDLTILGKSETPPFEIEDDMPATEDLRLKYRYLDLRRPKMQHALQVRHNALLALRKYFDEHGFREIETPMLMRSTPEGARDYVVPSRVHPGMFYALPQSPQLYKQLTMVAGCDRYVQIARCLRDEDLRADRQPEFTQIDVEMSFVSQDDILAMMEGAIAAFVKAGIGKAIPTPFPRITYDEAMEKYSTDKPDLRFDLFTHDVTDVAAKTDFQVFKTVTKAGGIVKCINPEKDFGRTELDAYIAFCQENGAKGMAWMRVGKDGLESNIVKYFSPELQQELIRKINAKPGSTLMFIADTPKKCNDVISRLRLKVADDLRLRDPSVFAFCYVTDFPLYEWSEDAEKWEAAHHAFTMPSEESLAYLESDPVKVRAQCYDMVLNGVEVASGSIRIHRADIQERVLKVIGLSIDDARRKFGFLLDAFSYGAPPHGGMAPGVDRLVALMLGGNDIREVIAFPKNKAGQNPMDGSPSEIDEQQLKELHLKIERKKK